MLARGRYRQKQSLVLRCWQLCFGSRIPFSSANSSRYNSLSSVIVETPRNSARLTPFALSCNKGLSRVAVQANALHADEARVDEMVKLVAYGDDGRSKRGKRGIRIAGGPNGESAGF